MPAYCSLAQYYDSFTDDVPYDKFAEYYKRLFELYGLKVSSILDVGCGTGTLTYLLQESGFDMIGADPSFDMLTVAQSKAVNGNSPLFLNQSADELDLYGTVDAAVCSLDGMNYIEPECMEESLRRILLFLEPGGVFIFDVNSPEKLIAMDGEMSIDETDDAFCVWRSEYDEEINACVYGFDLFTRNGSHWDRTNEEHIEYVYTSDHLKAMLESVGFVDIHIYGEFSFEPPKKDEQRIFFTARKRE